MIYVKRLNDRELVLNCEHIETIESLPDTTVTLINGKKLVLANSIEEVVQLTIDYKKSLLVSRLDV
ncbi:MAG: flagellar FlbD family protein [Lachnospirales bacterium]